MVKKAYKHVLFVFRRDLRLIDNTGLNAALSASEKVSAVFILDNNILSNKDLSQNALQFMITSLEELSGAIANKGGHLHIVRGKPEEIIPIIAKRIAAEAVYVNEDYSPYSHKRDHSLKISLEAEGLSFKSFHDQLLSAPGDIVNDQGKPYKVYSAFAKKLRLLKVEKPRSLSRGKLTKYDKAVIPELLNQADVDKLISNRNPNLYVSGGREEALNLIRRLKHLKDYTKSRDQIWNEKGTTLLSAHNKYGTVSIREVYWAVIDNLGFESILVNELIWRDFFTHIIYFFPENLSQSFLPQFQKIQWSENQNQFRKWCEGRTGYPLVDAGMRQLNETGYMHNRVRMLVASFLVKDLHINWQWGERYFASKLVDIDIAVNNGNWQWVASTGTDSQPYFRILNPYRQQEKFDPELIYIKRWLPEFGTNGYPQPIVDHKAASSRAKDLYAKAAAAAYSA